MFLTLSGLPFAEKENPSTSGAKHSPKRKLSAEKSPESPLRGSVDNKLTDEEEMQRVLEDLGLSCYVAHLKEEAIGMKALRLLSEEDLISLGIKLGHRRILLDYLKTEKENATKAVPAAVEPKDVSRMKASSKPEEHRKFSSDFGVLLQLDDLTLSKHLGTGLWFQWLFLLLNIYERQDLVVMYTRGSYEV